MVLLLQYLHKYATDNLVTRNSITKRDGIYLSTHPTFAYTLNIFSTISQKDEILFDKISSLQSQFSFTYFFFTINLQQLITLTNFTRSKFLSIKGKILTKLQHILEKTSPYYFFPTQNPTKVE